MQSLDYLISEYATVNKPDHYGHYAFELKKTFFKKSK
jgi:hypothetical protein